MGEPSCVQPPGGSTRHRQLQNHSTNAESGLSDNPAAHLTNKPFLCLSFGFDQVLFATSASELVIRLHEHHQETRRDLDDNRLVRVYLTVAGHEKERLIMEQFTKLEAVVLPASRTVNGPRCAN